MSLVVRTTDAGLVLAEYARDEASVGRALKQLDDRLVLQKEQSELAEGGWVYRVLRVWSDDHPPDLICMWADDHGNPLPLTSGLVDKVNGLRRDAPNKTVDADEHNRRHIEQVRRRGAALADAVIADHRAKVERGQVSVTLADVGRRPYWLRNRRPPESAGLSQP